MLDAVPSPSGLWLLTYGLPLEADLVQDLNGDSVTLLMAYALGLDPSIHLSGSLPVPVTDADSLGISFIGASEGITYTVQTSTDLKVWTTEGVTLSDILPGGQRTAAVPLGGGKRFLRLVVSE